MEYIVENSVNLKIPIGENLSKPKFVQLEARRRRMRGGY